jgi:hypothetical protein
MAGVLTRLDFRTPIFRHPKPEDLKSISSGVGHGHTQLRGSPDVLFVWPGLAAGSEKGEVFCGGGSGCSPPSRVGGRRPLRGAVASCRGEGDIATARAPESGLPSLLLNLSQPRWCLAPLVFSHVPHRKSPVGRGAS